MYLHQLAAGISLLFSLTFFVQLASPFLTAKADASAIAQNSPDPATTPNSPFGDEDRILLPPPKETPIPNRDLPRNNESISPTQLPWLLVSKDRDLVVPQPVYSKISAFFASQGLAPISCSTSPVAIVIVNNEYVACASPTSKFPPGNYMATIPDL